jgi:hypothetical protein
VSFLARHRYVLVVALVLASIGLSGLVVRLTREPDLGPPLMISPALASPVPPTLPAPPIGQAAAPSRLPKSAVASKSKSTTPKASKSTSRTPSAKPATPPAASSIHARYSVQRGRRGLYGGAMVTNTGAGAGTWTMTLTFESGVSVTRADGATLSGGGRVATFKGGSLGPDRSAMFSFSGTARDGASIRPVSCSINGKSCSGGGRS